LSDPSASDQLMCFAVRPRSHTYFSTFSLFSLDPKKVNKNAVTHEKYFNPKTMFTFSHFGKWGVVSGGPQGGSQSCMTPRNPLFGFLYVGKDIYLGRMSEETWLSYKGCTCGLCSCSTSW